MIDVKSYASAALPHLEASVERNRAVMEKLVTRLVSDVKAGKSLFAFGSGHAAIFTLELYHRAGGCSFLIPIVADYLLPTAGPPVVRVLERTAAAANMMLARAEPKSGEMIWIASQSGINPAVVDFALAAKARGLHTVAFTSVVHSSSVDSRHSSGKRLCEVCDETVDLGGFRGDAALEIAPDVRAGPLSSLGAIFLGHSILTAACAELEAAGIRCTYTSVNTPEGEARNKAIEATAMIRDPLLRG
ncbi:MAG: sugar isomerase domain-containing protein [Cryobacterium sp.]|nr:sugar isomerase domain-containing protein [Oligoflexia bacterium]